MPGTLWVGSNRPWSDEHAKIIRDAAGTMTATEIGDLVDRPAEAVRNYARRHEIPLKAASRERNSPAPQMVPKKPSIWTPEVVARLRELDAAGLSNSEMADALGPEFTPAAVTSKRVSLGLGKTGLQAKAALSKGALKTAAKWQGRSRGGLWNADKDSILRTKASALTAAQIGILIGRTESQVRKRAGRLGISLAKSGGAQIAARSWIVPNMPLQAGGNDQELVAKFLAERQVTQCPPMPAHGAVVPVYIGKKAA